MFLRLVQEIGSQHIQSGDLLKQASGRRPDAHDRRLRYREGEGITEETVRTASGRPMQVQTTASMKKV